MYVEKRYPNGRLDLLRNRYIYLRILSSIDEIGGDRLRQSSDRGTSEIRIEGTKSEQSLTNRRFY